MDPVVFGITMIFGLVIGLITPPVGNVLYIGCGISKISLLDLLKRIYPMVIVYVVILFLITFFPQLISFLPNMVM
jgi:TRAP-type C4-dicarboxylate transport system permease large subunit